MVHEIVTPQIVNYNIVQWHFEKPIHSINKFMIKTTVIKKLKKIMKPKTKKIK
jgi:hypothetical protein